MKVEARPNFVFILADDLGYADLGCYGGRANCSPVLDRLATEGLRFTDGYANSPVCSPTRLALMTGRWQYRLRAGNDEPLGARARGNPALGLPPGHPTLASLLREAGYATALVGKWHLGFLPHFGPLKSGYAEFFGVMSGGVDYFTHRDSSGAHDLFEGEEQAQVSGYLTDLISERSVDFIRRHGAVGKPFLLSVHYTAPHWPWETRADQALAPTLEKLYHFDGGSVGTYLTMIRQMDEGIGRILEALRDSGAEENTLIVFTSDNGGERFSDTWPLVGKKMDLLEGGIRVPYIVRWPRRVAPGSVTSQLAITMDWVATFLEAAGVAAHPDYPLDGQSLLRVLDSPGAYVEREFFWRMKFREQKAMRAGRWKYLSIEGNEFLYDLVTDARERADLKNKDPHRFTAMRAHYDEWDKTMPTFPDAAFAVLLTSGNLASSSL
jgi:arylsulfatase A-like enzyme